MPKARSGARPARKRAPIKARPSNVSVHVVIPGALHKRVTDALADEDRNLAQYVRTALRHYLTCSARERVEGDED